MRLRHPLTALVAAGLATTMGAAPLAASPSGKIKEKQREAQVVLAQIDALDRQLGSTVEQWDGARYELGKVRTQLTANRKALAVAERARKQAQLLVEQRLVTIYESDEPTTIDVVLGSSSLSDLIDRLQAEQSVATSDRQLAKHAAAVRDQLATAQRSLRSTEHKRAASVRQLASHRQQIDAMLSQRRRLLASVQSELVTMKAAEQRRQARLKAEAAKRLALEAAQRKQAAERQAAEEAAARRAAAKPKTTTTAPPPATTTTATTTTAPPATTTVPPVVSTPTTTDPATTTDATTTDATAAALPAGHPEAATIALKYLGVPYLWGGESPKGFDCSGLVAYVYAQLGVTLPHYSVAQYALGVAVPRADLQPGDLVFFDGLDHVGIYIGGGQFVHAPHTGDVVKITSLADYGAGYVGARRI